MNTANKEEIYTIEDIEALPEGERAELIDGKIYFMAAPGFTHQYISSLVNTDIVNYIRDNNGKCVSVTAPFSVFLNNDKNKTTYVEPDITVICDRSKIDSKGCHGAPDWVIEIVSPSSRVMDYFTKTNKYRDAGVKEYWVVDIEEKLVTVWCFENETIKHYHFGEEIPVGIFDGFSIKIPEEPDNL